MNQPDWLKDPTCACNKTIDPDPDIAGIGVLVSFIITSVFALISSTLLFISQWEASGNLFDSYYAPRLKRVWQWPFRRSPIFKSTLLAAVKSLGDTQLVTGIGVLITALVRLKSGITVYHFSIIIDLAWIAGATQAMVLYVAAIKGGYRDAKIGRWIRVILLLVQIGLLGFASVIQGNKHWDHDWYACQAGCFLPIAHIKLGGTGLQAFLLNAIFIIWSLVGMARLLGYMRLVTRQLMSLRKLFLQKMGIEDSTGQFNSYAAAFNRVCNYWEHLLALGCWNPNPLHYAKNFICIWCKILTSVLFLIPTMVLFLIGHFLYVLFDSILSNILMQIAWFVQNSMNLVSDRNWGTRYFKSQGQPDAENSWGFGQVIPIFILILPILAAIATYEDSKLERDSNGQTASLTPGLGNEEDESYPMVPLLGYQPHSR